jgi:hypothetical protein
LRAASQQAFRFRLGLELTSAPGLGDAEAHWDGELSSAFLDGRRITIDLIDQCAFHVNCFVEGGQYSVGAVSLFDAVRLLGIALETVFGLFTQKSVSLIQPLDRQWSEDLLRSQGHGTSSWVFQDKNEK